MILGTTVMYHMLVKPQSRWLVGKSMVYHIMLVKPQSRWSVGTTVIYHMLMKPQIRGSVGKTMMYHMLVKPHTTSSSINHSSLPLFDSGGFDVQFQDYLWLNKWGITHACAWCIHTMVPAHIILPKSQWVVVGLRAAVSMSETSQ